MENEEESSPKSIKSFRIKKLRGNFNLNESCQ